MSSSAQTREDIYLSWRVWVVYALLLVIGIPWYFPADDRTLWLGMPRWVVVSIAVSAVISTYTAWLLMRRWPGEANPDPEESQP